LRAPAAFGFGLHLGGIPNTIPAAEVQALPFGGRRMKAILALARALPEIARRIEAYSAGEVHFNVLALVRDNAHPVSQSLYENLLAANLVAGLQPAAGGSSSGSAMMTILPFKPPSWSWLNLP
jgi:hypothetical protein